MPDYMIQRVSAKIIGWGTSTTRANSDLAVVVTRMPEPTHRMSCVCPRSEPGPRAGSRDRHAVIAAREVQADAMGAWPSSP